MKYRIMNFAWLFLVPCMSISAISHASDGALPLFSVPDDPVVVATAGASASVRRGSGSLFSNPAGIAHAPSMVHISHGWLYQNLSRTNGSVAVRTPIDSDLFMGVAISSIGYPSMDRRDGPSTINDGEFNAHETKAGIALAYGFPFGLRIGCMGNIVESRIAGSGVTGWAADFGIQQSIPSVNVECGIAVLNIGTLKAFDSTESPDQDLWAVYQAGLSWATPVKGINLAGSVRMEHDDELLELFGLEYSYSRYSLRAGKIFGHASRDFAAGGGVQVGSLSIDYAWDSNGYDLGSSHRLSMGWLL